MDKKEFKKLKFNIPEPVVLECPTCHDSIDECDNCGIEFEPDKFAQDEVSCGKQKHICGDCYDEFDNEVK